MALSIKPIEIVEQGKHQLLTKAKHWERVELSNIADVQNGFAFKSSLFTHSGEMPLIRIRDIDKRKTENFYSGSYSSDFVVKKGDILIGMDGDFNVAIWQGADGLLNQRVCRLIPRTEKYSAKFLFLCLQPYLNAINAETSSVTVKHLSSKTISEIPLPLPPLPEQHRIVAKIEALFSELDKGMESLKTAREQLKIYRQALLKHAFSGKLTAQWRADRAKLMESEGERDNIPLRDVIPNGGGYETAEALLQRIQTERKQRYRQQLKDWEANGKQGGKPKPPKTLPPLTDGELAELPELPESWIWTKVSDLSIKITDGEHFRPQTQSEGVYFLSAKDVQDHGVVFDDPLFIDQETASKARLRCDPERNDILIVSRGATVGRMCIVKTDEVFCLLGSVILIKALKSIDSNYFLYGLKSPLVNKRIIDASGATAQQAIYLRDIQHVPIPLCPFSEQLEISKILEEKLSIIDELERTLESEISHSETLRQSILKKAFSGQLVPQDPNDEPASVLLERIQSEKAAVIAPIKKGKKHARN